MILKQDFPPIKQGADFSAYLPISSTTVDLTTCDFYCEIRRFSGAPLLAKVSVNYASGRLNFSIPHSVTANLPQTSGNNQWKYDLFVQLDGGERICLAAGSVLVDPQITEFS